MTAKTVGAALGLFQEQKYNGSADSLFTVDKIQTRFYREDCSAVNHDPDNLLRTQDLEPWFEENSNLYIFTKVAFAKTNARIGVKPMMFVTPKFESIDIDTPDDWDFGIVVSEYLFNKGKSK
jgi:CMP-N-acetylneuraminic acid synthetase